MLDQQFTLLAWALGLVALINIALIAVVLYRRFTRNQPTFAPRWSLLDLWVGVQLIAVVLTVVFVPLIFIAFLAGVKMDSAASLSSPRAIMTIVLPSAVLQNVAFFGVPAAFVNLKYRLPLRAIGLPKLPTRREVIAGVAIGILGMVISQLLSVGIDAFTHHFANVAWVKAVADIDQNNPVHDIEKALPNLGIFGLILAVLGVGISAPFGEEMLFRGFAFNTLKRRCGLPIALIGSALLFTLPHSYGFGLVPVFAMGLLLAWSYNNTGSLWTTIFAHATNNTVSVLVAFLFRDAVK